MNFPKDALLVLLNYAKKGGGEITPEVFEAGLTVLKYVWHLIHSKVVGSEESKAAEDIDIVEALEQVLDESGAKAFGPGLWLTIGLWVVEKILVHYFKG